MSDLESSDAPRADATPAYQRRKAQRPAEILEAALEEFYSVGYGAASLARIAQRAGVSRATLYLYFDGKQALFEAAADAAMGATISELAEATFTDSQDTATLLRQFLGRVYQTLKSSHNSALMRIMIAEGKQRPELVARHHAVTVRRGQAALEAIIARGLARGDLRPGPATEIPQIIIAPAIYLLIHTMIFGDIEQLDADAFFAAHVDMLLHGIAAPPA